MKIKTIFISKSYFYIYHTLRSLRQKIVNAEPVRVLESLKVMEIGIAIFQDQESFRKERILKMAMEKFWIFDWKNSKIS